MKSAVLTAVLALLLAAAAARPAEAESVFPVTVAHALGETTVPATPRRIVSLGLNDQNFLYALGLAPVGVKEWWGRRPYATWPWAEPLRRSLGAAPAVSIGSGIDFEWVLAQKPDLIVATCQDLDRQSYVKLSRIAPLIAAPAGFPAWQAPWQEQLRLLDRAGPLHERSRLPPAAGGGTARRPCRLDLPQPRAGRPHRSRYRGMAERPAGRSRGHAAVPRSAAVSEEPRDLARRPAVDPVGRPVVPIPLSLRFALDGLVPRLASVLDGELPRD